MGVLVALTLKGIKMKRNIIFSTIFVLITGLLILSNLVLAANFTYRYSRSSQSGYDVQLMKHYVAWDGVGFIAGSWDSDNSVYEFMVPLDDTTYYRPDVHYKIMENAVTIIDSIQIGDIVTHDEFEDHRDSTAAHGVSGDVVGETDTQTLTNKTIDGDDNTIQDLHGWSLKSGTSVRPIRIHPDTAEDMYIHMVEGDANGSTIQVADTAGTTDGVLTIKADSVDFQDDAGNDIVLSGIVLGTADNCAVPKSSLDSAKARIAALEVGGSFSGSPEVSLSLGLISRGRGSFMAQASFDMDATNRDSVARYEIYYTNRDLHVDAGATSTDELETLRNGANSALRRGGELKWKEIESYDEILWVWVVAFDAGGTKYNSDGVFIRPGGNPNDPARDGNGEIITIWRTIGNYVSQAPDTSDGVAAEFVEYIQSDTTPTIKDRRCYVYHSEDNRMYVSFWLKSGATGNGIIRVQIMDGATIKKTAQYLTPNTAYPAHPEQIEIDLSSGLEEDHMYDIEIEIWSTSTNTTTLKGDIHVDVEANVQIY